MHSHQVLAQLRGGAASGGARIVQLMHQTGGECAERGHLLLLQGYALHLLEAVGHIAQDGLANLRATRHQIPELFFVKLKKAAGCSALNASRIRNIGQQRQLAEGISAFDLAECYIASIGLKLMNAQFAFKQDPEEMSDLTLIGDGVAGVEAELVHPVETVQLVVFQRGENGNLAQLR